jgi:cytochrome c oxidase subunit 7c
VKIAANACNKKRATFGKSNLSECQARSSKLAMMLETQTSRCEQPLLSILSLNREHYQNGNSHNDACTTLTDGDQMLAQTVARRVAAPVARRGFTTTRARPDQYNFTPYHYSEGPRSNLPFNTQTRFFAVRYWAFMGTKHE